MRPTLRLLLPFAAAVLATGLVAFLLISVFERQQEAKLSYFRVVDIPPREPNPEIWGRNFPTQHEGWSSTLRTSTFDEARVLHAWSGQVSDDVVLGRAVQSLGKSIAFVPDAVVYSDDPTDGPRLWEWCTRQVRLTRRYMPTLWLVGLLINLWLRGSAVLSVLVVGTEFLLLVLGIGAGSSPAQRLLLWAAAVGCLLPSLTVLRTAQRLAWWRSKGGQWGAPVPSSVGRTARLGPLEAALMTLVLLASARGRFITWRGRRYDLRGDRPPQTRP